MEWSPEQDSALQAVQRWLRSAKPDPIFRLFGYAGTGKTTLAKHLAAGVDGEVLFGAFTGKAADVLRRRGCPNATTLHSLIYCPERDAKGGVRFVRNEDSPLAYARLLIVDECSMVDRRLGEDLLSFGRRILVLGDPAQLPPVEGTGFFTNAKPNVLLTEIHRQAQGNPIIALATHVRAGGTLEIGSWGEGASAIVAARDLKAERVAEADQVLVGRNDTRRRFNTRLRELAGHRHPDPVVGDKLVCGANDRQKGLLNGGLWRVEDTLASGDPDWVRLRLRAETERVGHPRASAEPEAGEDVDAGEEAEPGEDAEATRLSEAVGTVRRVSVRVHRAFLAGREDTLPAPVRRRSDDFSYGNALTVHKAQGSQWGEVVLFDESKVFGEHAHRWLYTGLTRAETRVTVVVDR